MENTSDTDSKEVQEEVQEEVQTEPHTETDVGIVAGIAKDMTTAFKRMSAAMVGKEKQNGEEWTQDEANAIDKMLHNKMMDSARKGMLTKGLAQEVMDNGLGVHVVYAGKYTITELVVKGCHFHGITARDERDEDNKLEGIGRSLNRAMNQMMVWAKFGEMKDIGIVDDGKKVAITKEELDALVSRDG